MSISEPAKIITPWASTGSKNPIPPTANNTTGAAGFDKGFPDITMTPEEAGGIPPAGQDFNGIFYQITEIIRYIQAGGTPTYSQSFADAIGGYPKGSIVLGGDGVTLWQSQADSNSIDPNVSSSGWLSVDVGLRGIVQPYIEPFTAIDSFSGLVSGGDWTDAVNAAFQTGLPVLPNPSRVYNISGAIQSSGVKIIGKFNIRPFRPSISNLGDFTFNPEMYDSEIKKNIKLLYCMRVYDLVELLYIRSMGFNMIFHGGDMTSERPEVDTVTALGLMLDNALTANLQVNMTTGHIINEDSMAIGYVTAFKDYHAVWGFSVFDEPTFNGASVARQNERLAVLRPLTNKNLNVTDVVQNYPQFRSGVSPWALGYDTFFVDSYSHTITGTIEENISNDLNDMRVAAGVAAVQVPGANIIPMCGLFKGTSFSTSFDQIKGSSSIFFRMSGGDFSVFAWDAIEEGITSTVKSGTDLRGLAKSMCQTVVNGCRIPTVYRVGGETLVGMPPAVSAKDGLDLLQKRSWTNQFIGAGTALGVVANGVESEWTSPDVSQNQPLGGLFFIGQFPVGVLNVETKKYVSLASILFDIKGQQSGSFSVGFSGDGGGTVGPSVFSHPFSFSSGQPSSVLDANIFNGDYWRGYKLAVAMSVNPPVNTTTWRLGIYGYIVVSEW